MSLHNYPWQAVMEGPNPSKLVIFSIKKN